MWSLWGAPATSYMDERGGQKAISDFPQSKVWWNPKYKVSISEPQWQNQLGEISECAVSCLGILSSLRKSRPCPCRAQGSNASLSLCSVLGDFLPNLGEWKQTLGMANSGLQGWRVLRPTCLVTFTSLSPQAHNPELVGGII